VRKFLFILFIPFFGWAQSPGVPADSIISFAKQNQGIKYCYGNCTPKNGFDCSGFVYYVFGHFNIKVPRSSLDYETFGRVVKIDSARKGDVIVFTGTKPKNRRPGHVGIVISEPGEELKFIHSSSGKKTYGIVITDYSNSPYYKSRFIKVVRIEGVK
jgi:cell wall-associated NlpC family hydrolase